MTFDDWWNKIVGNGQWTTLERLAAHQAWHEGRAYALKEAAKLALAWIGERIQMNDKMEYVLTEYDEGSFRAAILGDQVSAKIPTPPAPDILMDARQNKLHVDLPGRRLIRTLDTEVQATTDCKGCISFKSHDPACAVCYRAFPEDERRYDLYKPVDCPTCAESVDGAPGSACCGQCREEDTHAADIDALRASLRDMTEYAESYLSCEEVAMGDYEKEYLDTFHADIAKARGLLG